MISIDRKVFEKSSDVRRRISLYGSLVDELHVIVFAKKSLLFKNEEISENVFLYPTNSSNKLRYIHDAIKIGNSILGVDLITTQDPFETGVVGVTLARKLGNVRLEIQLHTDFLSQYFRKWNIKNTFRVVIGKRVLKKADCIRVVSNKIKTSIKKKLPHISVTPTVLPVFVDINKIRNTPISIDLHKKYPQFEHITLMISRLEKEKNINRVIKVFGKIIKNYPKTGLVIIGDGSEKDALELTVKRLKLAENVIFEGWQEDQDEVISYYKSANLFLNSSLYEGYGRTFVEALASGTPVLSTDVGVAREVGADIFTTNEELTKEIIEYIDGKEGNRELKTYPYKNEEEYLNALKNSWEECGKK